MTNAKLPLFGELNLFQIIPSPSVVVTEKFELPHGDGDSKFLHIYIVKMAYTYDSITY